MPFEPGDETETTVWALSQEMHRDNLKRRVLPAQRGPVDDYLQSVLDKVCPELKGKLTVRLFPDAGTNAFALPNGIIYVGGGLLLRLTTEAQLAGLLAHEATHVDHRHGVASLETSAVLGGVNSALNIAIQLIPIPGASLATVLVAPYVKTMMQFSTTLTLSTSVFGFSKARETEADEVGFSRLVAAGYHPGEAGLMFSALATEAQLAGADSALFFSSHPAMAARVENFARLAAASPVKTGFVGEAEYDAVIRPHRRAFIEQEFRKVTGTISRDRGLLAYFSRPDIEVLLSPVDVAFFKGQATYRLGRLEDIDAGIAAYRRAVELGVPYLKVAEPILLMQLRQKNKAAATLTLQDWAAAGKSPSDVDYLGYLKVVAELGG
jgi:Zn-dependent protease with chaperone function